MDVKIVAIVALVLVVLGSIAAGAYDPESWPTIIGFTLPITATLITLIKVQDYHMAVNSKMDELLETTAKLGQERGARSGNGDAPTGRTAAPPA